MAAALDFDHICARKNVDGRILGSDFWGQIHYDNQKVHAVKDPNHRQTTMAEWTQEALRWAYPYDRMPHCPNYTPREMDASIVRGRDTNPITADELQAWCALIDAVDKIPQRYA
jgi:hypothetical protein